MTVISPDHYSNRSSELVTGRNRFGAFLLPQGYTVKVSPPDKCPPLQCVGLEYYQHIPPVFKLQFSNE
jgi:hypothetical protein